jgi:hypothetical protein
MKKYIRQILVVVWSLVVAFFIIGLYLSQDIVIALAFSLMFGLPAWAIQLITLGIVNPLRLFKFGVEK